MKKKFEGMLILDWKTKGMRVMKKVNKSKLKPHEIVIKIDIDLEIPEYKEHTVKGKIIVPETKVEEMVVDNF